jgi:hypothetical protein
MVWWMVLIRLCFVFRDHGGPFELGHPSSLERGTPSRAVAMPVM